MEAHSLRAPSSDGGLLAAPHLPHAPGLLAENAERLARWEYDVQGRGSQKLRHSLHREIPVLARRFANDAGFSLPPPPSVPFGENRLVVTGHQPELFHPGVWVKNFAASAIAAKAGAISVNLIVDNDVPKGIALRVPDAATGGLGTTRVEFDAKHADVPHEDATVADEALFATFGRRLGETLPRSIRDPLIESFWPIAVASRQFSDRVGLRLARARQAIEADWGVRNLEIPLSAICETEGFLWFASHLLARLPAYQQIHNEALAAYRSLYRIRSRHHPVPALGAQGEWREAPFWIWRSSAPRRRPLLVRQKSRTMELRIGGEDAILMEIPLAEDRDACCAVEQLAQLPSRGVRLRTRALTTTMFARYWLSDLFLHGIGGAKYDELGDEIARRFLGIEPPAFATLSMTLWLGLPDDPGASGRLETVQRILRDLTHNPDRHLAGPIGGTSLKWIEEKRAAIAGPTDTRARRIARFHEIRRCNAALAGEIEGVRRLYEAERDRLKESARRHAVARSREYAMVLHSREKLRRALSEATASLRA